MLPYMLGTAMKLRALAEIREHSAAKGLNEAALAKALPRLRALRDNRDGLKRALRLEYTMSANLMIRLAKAEKPALSGLPPQWLAKIYFRPNRTRALIAADFRTLLKDIGRGCPATAPPEPEPERWWKNPQVWTGNLVGVILRSIGTPNWNRLKRRCCEEDFWTGATELTVAAQAYARAAGKLPGGASALSPRYFPELPQDPFTGEKLSYSPTAGITTPGVDVQGKALSAQLKF
jgi:hypothetical protein